MEKYIAIAANIGTFVGSILVLFTLIEMKQQRKASVKPEIVILTNPFFIRENSFNILLTERPIKTSDCYWLDILNIGLSPCKDIKIEFSYNDNEFIELLKGQDVEIIKDGAGLIINSKSERTWTDLKNDAVQEIPFMNVMNNISESKFINIPLAYSRFIKLIENSKMPTNALSFGTVLPKLKMKIAYTDLLGNKYYKKCIFYFYMSSINCIDNVNRITTWHCNKKDK